jgi:hypothetical protein
MKILFISIMDSSVTDTTAEASVLFMQVFASTLTLSLNLKVKEHNILEDVQLRTFDKFAGALISFVGKHTS